MALGYAVSYFKAAEPRAIGFLEISFGVGMAFGPWFGGFVFDFTGSYRWAFIVVFAAFLFSFVTVYKSQAWYRRFQLRTQPPESVLAAS